MRKSRLVAGVAAVASAALTLPAGAQTVPVTLENPSGTRVVTVENMTGTELASLDFGKSRELPFRVKVQDTDYARTGFSMSSSMTNLYVNDNGLQYGQKIASAKVSLDSQANPLNVLGVSATVQPIVGTVTTLVASTVCGVLGLVGNDCVLTTTGLTGKVVEDLTMTVDDLAADVPTLPLVPQANAKGAFTNPSFAAGTAGELDPAKTTTAPTELLLVSGGTNTSPVLTELDAALNALPLDSVVNSADVMAALQAQFPLTWGLLSQTELAEVLAATDPVPVALTADQILTLTGTYMSLPTLNVDATNAAAGNYQGTLVVTSGQ